MKHALLFGFTGNHDASNRRRAFNRGRLWLRLIPHHAGGLLVILSTIATPLLATTPSGPASPAYERQALERLRATWERENRTRTHPEAAGAGTTAEPGGDGVWSHLGIPELAGHVAIYDRRRDRMLIFGGIDNDTPNYDLWSLSMTDPHPWRKLAVAGTHPPLPRSAIYDPVRDRIVMLVGWWYDGDTSNDVWTVNLSGAPRWTRLDPTGPKPNVDGPTIYDPVRDRLVMTTGGPSVWTLSLSGAPVWTELTATGTPPGERYRPVAIYDPVRDRLVWHHD